MGPHLQRKPRWSVAQRHGKNENWPGNSRKTKEESESSIRNATEWDSSNSPCRTSSRTGSAKIRAIDRVAKIRAIDRVAKRTCRDGGNSETKEPGPTRFATTKATSPMGEGQGASRASMDAPGVGHIKVSGTKWFIELKCG